MSKNRWKLLLGVGISAGKVTHMDARHWVRVSQDISIQPVQSLLAPLGVDIKALQILTCPKGPVHDTYFYDILL